MSTPKKEEKPIYAVYNDAYAEFETFTSLAELQEYVQEFVDAEGDADNLIVMSARILKISLKTEVVIS